MRSISANGYPLRDWILFEALISMDCAPTPVIRQNGRGTLLPRIDKAAIWYHGMKDWAMPAGTESSIMGKEVRPRLVTGCGKPFRG